MNGKLIRNISAVLVVSILVIACSTVAITGRKQLNIIPNSQILSMSFSQYDQFMNENKLSRDQQKTAMIKRVGSRIQKSVEQYFAQNNMSAELNGFQWEFNLIESDQVNAWCMPGGKVVFYTGILPICEDETGVAVVMGHEIAHAVAEHGSERMSQGLITQLGGMALDKALENEPDLTRSLALTAFGLGSQVGVLLPFSRLHESEADHLGLIFMAMAGYNPNAAVDFWGRMAKLKGGQAPPEFLSTHPSDQTRINDLKKKMPEAMKHYRK
jgi:predicted Zn-dependent protease